jgi:hypothetical protein
VDSNLHGIFFIFKDNDMGGILQLRGKGVQEFEMTMDGALYKG